jgi:NADPH-dependent ferric siderophore reductase
VRRETRRRALIVTEIEQIAPKMRRIRFAPPDMHDFESAGFDDHVKLFIPGAMTDRCADRTLCVIKWFHHPAAR